VTCDVEPALEALKRREMFMKRSFTVFALLTATFLVAAGSGFGATDVPTPGTRTFTECHFDPHTTYPGPGVTFCHQLTVIVYPSHCWGSGPYQIWSEVYLNSAREFQGNVVLPGLNGVEVEGDYVDVIHPHARLIYDSGIHGSGIGGMAYDPSCA
jgi:hypothetical protein